MSIRLNKALRNLNISLKTATDFLLRHKSAQKQSGIILFIKDFCI